MRLRWSGGGPAPRALRNDQAPGGTSTPNRYPIYTHRFASLAGPGWWRLKGRALQPQSLVHPQVHVHGLDGRAAGALAQVVQAVIEHAFSPSVHLHRIQANVRPENSRSVALLHRLGFEDEGLAREYLFINGAWCDHRMFALRNAAFTGGPVLGGPPAN